MNKCGGAFIIRKNILRLVWVMLPLFLATACASVDVPDGRTVQVPTATPPLDRYEGLNEKRDPITRVRLGRDVLMPQPLKEDMLPNAIVGPYELRDETLASALQLILDDYDVSLAFETDEGLKRHVTVSNLHGKLKDVVNRVCSLADLYCHFEAGTLTIKNTETFVVDLPPIGGSMSAGSISSSSSGGSSGGSAPAAPAASGGGSSPAAASGGGSDNSAYTQIAGGLEAVIGTKPVIDGSTRVMIYTATQRSNKYALQYFERLRKNTALIIFETHIWEVTLDNNNRTGINWTKLFGKMGNFKITTALTGDIPTGAAEPITITPSYTGSDNLTTDMVLKFISARGTVKTVSQPQITVLSGSTANFSVSQEQNYVKGSTRTPATATTAETVSITTDTVTSGINMSVTSAWDQSTVYGNLGISLNDLLKIDEFKPDANTSVQLPQTTSRNLQTEIRVRPGDAILIGGMVSEKDNLSESGPGFMKPLFATSRGVEKTNTELVFLLRPRVVAFVMGDDSDTPAVVDVPKEMTAPPDITDHVRSVFGRGRPAAPVPAKTVDDGAALPTGISPEAFAPQNTAPIPAPEDVPVSLQQQNIPIPLSGGGSDGGN